MIGRDALGDVLEQNRLAGARGRDDQRALALTDRSDDIDHARGKILPRRIDILHLQPLFRVERGQIVEMDLVPRFSGSSKLMRLTFTRAK